MPELEPGRLLTDADVKAIAEELKTGLLKDFQLEVGRGVLFWVKRLVILILILFAIYGAFGDRALIESIFTKAGEHPK